MRIAVSKTSANYERWLKNSDNKVIIVNMYGLDSDSAISELSFCSGLLLTGGEDVNPALYGKPDEISKCEEIDYYRDSLEIALIKGAVKAGIPVFGICRGEQIINVAFGGTLHTDIPSDVDTLVCHRVPSGPKDCMHIVVIDPASILFKITGVTSDTVNSRHHQSVDRPAPGFRISALSENGVAEAIEIESPDDRSFIMGVQWHPERMNPGSVLSKTLVDKFLAQVRVYDSSSGR